jgi:hypothetical protein
MRALVKCGVAPGGKCRALRQLRCVPRALEGCAAGCPVDRPPVLEPETYVPSAGSFGYSHRAGRAF